MRARVAVLSALCIPFVTLAEPPPVTSFTNFPSFESAKISPGGTYLAFTRRTTEHEVLTVLRLQDLKPTTQSHFGDRIDISSFSWASDSRLLISPTRRFPGLIAFKAPTGEIIGLDADGKGLQLLFGYNAGARSTDTRIAQRQSTYAPATVVGRIPDHPAEVLIQTYGYSTEGEFNSAYRMNVRTGLLTKVAGSPVRDGRFFTDTARQVRIVSGDSREGNSETFYRGADGDAWKMMSDSAMDAGFLWPAGPTAEAGRYLVLDNRKASTLGAYSWTPANDDMKLLFRSPEADLDVAGVDYRGVPWGFEYYDHFPRYWYADDANPLAGLHKWLTTKFPDHVVDVTSATDDMKLAVVRVSAPRMPPVFYVMDVPNRTFLHQLQTRPDLKAEQLANVDPIEYESRDGKKLRGYLTVPRGSQQAKLPMIVLVHGGPHGVYDTFGFDYEAQLFASRGYAVLQVNFRGSGGRGRDFEAAGYGKWGREMQDDVTDGVRWAVADGVADPKRICIFGASYGAYAALNGVAREPDMFRCAVGMAGIYDLSLLFEKGDIQSVVSGLNYLKMALGSDQSELRARSPVYNADKIRVPVLLLHGKVDDRAPYEHAKRMRDALTKAGNPPEFSTEWGEGHGFFDEANRAAAYEKILAFFAKNLGT